MTRRPNKDRKIGRHKKTYDLGIQAGIYAEPNVRFSVPSASHIVEEERIKAETAIETIRGINGQDDIGIEDFIKTVKKKT